MQPSRVLLGTASHRRASDGGSRDLRASRPWRQSAVLGDGRDEARPYGTVAFVGAFDGVRWTSCIPSDGSRRPWMDRSVGGALTVIERLLQGAILARFGIAYDATAGFELVSRLNENLNEISAFLIENPADLLKRVLSNSPSRRWGSSDGYSARVSRRVDQLPISRVLIDSLTLSGARRPVRMNGLFTPWGVEWIASDSTRWSESCCTTGDGAETNTDHHPRNPIRSGMCEASLTRRDHAEACSATGSADDFRPPTR